MRRPTTVLAMAPDLPRQLFTEAARERLCSVATVDPDQVLTEFQSPGSRAELARAEVLLTGWGCPPLSDSVLAAAPHLCAIVHASGTVKGHVTPACWDRGIVVSTAAEPNAQPVAEFTLAMILLAGKSAHLIERLYRERRAGVNLRSEFPHIGNYGRTVGVIGPSRIGRRVVVLLRPFDLRVVVS